MKRIRKVQGYSKNLAHHSLPVELTPEKDVTVKLVKDGYLTQEFTYHVPASDDTVTKTMIVERCEATIISATLDKTEYEVGEIVRASYTVKNTGNVTTDITIKTGIGTPIAPVTKHDVAPGVTQKGGAGWNAPSTSGDYKMVVTVEACGKETDRKELPFTVKPQTGTLAVTTSPTGATVKVGTETKTSPCSFTLALGDYTVIVTKTGYDKVTDSVTITAGTALTKKYSLTRSKATITFKTVKEDGTELTGVSVYINGTKRGET